MNLIHNITLCGENASLIPLSLEHADELADAVKDGELWKVWYAFIPSPEEMKLEIQERLALQKDNKMIPFAIVNNKTEKIIGMTSYCFIDRTNKRLNIGRTWIKKSEQRTGLNTACKLMLLKHAFEVLECNVVGFQVNSFNLVSRIAIERLGAKFDGVLRNYIIHKNNIACDYYLFSIIKSEWSDIEKKLQRKSEFNFNRITTNISHLISLFNE